MTSELQSASEPAVVTPQTTYVNDRWMLDMAQAIERHGRLWSNMVRCPKCLTVFIACWPEKYGFKSVRCIACKNYGCVELPRKEYASQADDSRTQERVRSILGVHD